jgi:competence protein ComEA
MFDLQITNEQKIIIIVFSILILIGIVVGLRRERKEQMVLLNTTDRELQIELAGAVKTPGIYRARSGTRVWEALRLAGGICSDADLSNLNLVEPVKDGVKLLVPFQSPTEITGVQNDQKKVALNSATAEELDQVPGIGKATAEKIIALRDHMGGLHSWDELKAIPRLGAKSIEKLKSFLTLE